MTVGLSPVLRRAGPGVLLYWCPGCGKAHELDINAANADGKRIGWDGDVNRPSVGCDMTFPGCRHVLSAGVLRFDGSCTHSLAGKSVPLPAFPLPNQ